MVKISISELKGYKKKLYPPNTSIDTHLSKPAYFNIGGAIFNKWIDFPSGGGYSPSPFSNTTIPIQVGVGFYQWAFGERGDSDRWKVLTHFDHRGPTEPTGCLVMSEHLVMGVSTPIL